MTMITSQMREPEISRTQEMAVSISQDGGQTYRELMSGVQLQPAWHDARA
jgi:hypothetical protein